MPRKPITLLIIFSILLLSFPVLAEEANHAQRLDELDGDVVPVASDIAIQDDYSISTVDYVLNYFESVSNSTIISNDVATNDGTSLDATITETELTIVSPSDGVHDVRINYDLITPFIVDNKVQVKHFDDFGNIDATWTQEVQNIDGFAYFEDVPFTGVVITAPVTSFTQDVTSGSVPLAVQFTDTSNLGGSLLDNNSFESGYPGTINPSWINNVAYSRSTSQHHTGSYSFSVQASSASDPYIDLTPFSLPSSSTVLISTWVYCSTDTYIKNPAPYEQSGTYRSVGNWGTFTSIAGGTWTKYSYLGSTGSSWGANSGVRFSGAFFSNGTADTSKVVYYDDVVMLSPISWSWNFGDGSTSTSQNPSHTYSVCGVYPVSLTVTNSNTSNTATVNSLITANPVTGFTGTPTSGSRPLSVTFTDSSTGSPNTWSWNFGDSGTSSSQNPSHTYNSAGTYSVTLTASNGSASNSYTRSSYISVGKTTPVITWSNPAFLTYPTALSGAQLNADAGVAGTYSYTPASGTVLSIGNNTLHVDFTPTDTTNYNSASKDVYLNVIGGNYTGGSGNFTISSTSPTFVTVYPGTQVNYSVVGSGINYLYYSVDGVTNFTAGSSINLTFPTQFHYYNVTIYALNATGVQSNMLVFSVVTNMTPANTTVTAVDYSDYTRLQNAIMNLSIVEVAGVSLSPWTNLIGWENFWLFIIGCFFMFLFLNHGGKASVIGVLGCLFGFILIGFLPAQIHFFVYMAIAVIFASALYGVVRHR